MGLEHEQPIGRAEPSRRSLLRGITIGLVSMLEVMGPRLAE